MADALLAGPRGLANIVGGGCNVRLLLFPDLSAVRSSILHEYPPIQIHAIARFYWFSFDELERAFAIGAPLSAQERRVFHMLSKMILIRVSNNAQTICRAISEPSRRVSRAADSNPGGSTRWRPGSQPINNAVRIGTKPNEVTGADHRIGSGQRSKGFKIGMNVRDQEYLQVSAAARRSHLRPGTV
jgi:hypothetical protein